jgi:hypothetical protein
MKTYKKIQTFQWALVMMLLGIVAGCTKKDFSEDYDIQWPVPKITSIAPAKETIGKTITITGEKFEKTNKVTIGVPEVEAKIVTASATSIVVEIPRTVSAGPVTVYTLYKQKGVSEQSFTPVYLAAKVTQWPARITRGQAFVIKGENMDMVTEVEVDGTKIPITTPPGAATDQISVGTIGLTLPDAVVVKVTKARGSIENGTSGSIPVENPTAFFIPEAPILMFDFENGVNPYVNYGGSTATSGLNASGAPRGRDARYLTVQKKNAVAWEGLGEVNYTTPINLSLFHKPHMTFLVNTR